MASRSNIIDYLRFCLDHITSNPDENRAIATAHLADDIQLQLSPGLNLITQDNSIIIANQTDEGVVTSISIDFPGLFYDGASVTIDSPGVVQAQGEAQIENGSVINIDITQPGGRYLQIVELLTQLGFMITTQAGATLETQGSPTLNAPAVYLSGDGTGANAYATVNAWGAVTSVVVDNAGSGYSSAPTVTFELPDTEIEPATATASIRRGIVSTIDVDFGSQQYLFIPNCVISASSVIFNSSSAKAYRSYKYLNDINDFPTITLGGTTDEETFHYGDHNVLKKFHQSIRGYVMDNQTEDSLSASENLARDIETVVDRFADMSSNLSVYSAKVTQVTTDEGLLSPYGVCDLTVEIEYEERL